MNELMNEQNQQPIQKWEYTSARLLNGLEDLNKLGEEGWEVVDGVVLNAGREIVFKRPKQAKPTPKPTNDYGYSR